VVPAQLAAAEPYRPDTVADGGEAFGFTVRAASVRGLSKRHLGGPRQDDLCLRPHPPTRSLIVAVADGVSAAPRSDLAAALAVRHAAANAERQLERGAADIDWGEVFRHAAWALVEEQRRASGDADAGVDEAARSLATTLTVAVIGAPRPDATNGSADPEVADGPHTDGPRVQVAAIGDSPALVLADDQFRVVVGETAHPDHLIGGGTTALPRDVGSIDHAVCTLESGSVLLICTDGLALPLGSGAGEVGLTLARELATAPDIIDFARLLDFSRATYDDDRTLVAVWPGQPT
jgi:serine/threonine protein phosphatase PrpC